jgi:hypothetical protein
MDVRHARIVVAVNIREDHVALDELAGKDHRHAVRV